MEENYIVKGLEKEIIQLHNAEKLMRKKQTPECSVTTTKHYTCDQCEKLYRSNEDLSQHMRTHHDNIPQKDGLDSSLSESRVDESGSNSLTRLMALMEGLNSHVLLQ